MIDKYLPIGSIVLLKGAKKRVMIVGFVPIVQDGSNKKFDYSGCLYPEGIIKSTEILAFNHDQIEHIYFIGYNDEEERQFKAKLKETE